MCLKYDWDEETGVVRTSRGPNGTPELRLLNMGPSFLAPCRNDKGCRKGTPEKPKTLHPINEQCFQHYRECKAVGHFPDDPIVRKNAVIISEILADIEHAKRTIMERTLINLAARICLT